jgi:hypothetical protein
MNHEANALNSEGLPCRRAEYKPPAGSLGEANHRFHDEYDRALDRTRLRLGNEIPVILVFEGKLVTHWRGVRDEVQLIPEVYHKLKAVAHQVVSTYMRGERLKDKELSRSDRAALLEQHAILESSFDELQGPVFQDICAPETKLLLQASLDFLYRALSAGKISSELLKEYARTVGPFLKQITERPAVAVLDSLHAHMDKLRRQMSCEEWQDLHVVVTGSRQARAGEVTLQYFSKLFGEFPGVGASKEDKIIFVEGSPNEEKMLLAVCEHVMNGTLGEAFFEDKFALQRDVLADAAAVYLEKLFSMPQ